MAQKRNPKCILFLHEGYTEREFYDEVFLRYLPKRGVRMYKVNLKGIGNNLNKVVYRKIKAFLADKAEEKEIYVACANDREGTRDIEPLLNIDKLRKEFVTIKKARIVAIDEIVATQDIESWFFHDLDGIYDFLKVPAKERKFVVHDVERVNNKTLAQLFRKHGKLYKKRGKPAENFISTLDLEKIYRSATDLETGIEQIIAFIG